MGFAKGRIVLDSESGGYFAGQKINGQIQFDQGKNKTIHGIYVGLKGFCKVHWTTQESRRVNDRTEHYTVDHSSYEEYVNRKIFVFGSADGGHHLKAGHYEFDFEFHVPESCPSSFEGSEGHIRYRLKAVMVTKGMLSSNKELFAPIRVVAQTDLNLDPYCKEPIEFEMFQSYCCWCFNSGSSELKVTLPAGGYCPGDIIPIEISCENNSSVEISRIALTIKKKTRYIAESVPDSREEKEKVVEIKKGPVPRDTTRRWTVEMELPDMDVVNLYHCQYIDIDYYFKVTTEVSGCHSDEDESQPIIFGTIPLKHDNDNSSNTKMPIKIQQVNSYPAAVVNQPLPTSPYPNNQAYPNPTPYPAVNPPYPTTPNIGVVPPYPTTPVNQPYPNIHPASPYPGGNQFPSPYPPTNQPHPGNNSNQNMSPYPQNNQGYPGIAPNQNVLPYPGNSPIPPHHGKTPSPVPPYPDNGVSLVNTGTVGFRVPGGDGVQAPLLPPGANAPYPLSPGNPYASASAPEPATPDSVDKNLSAMMSSETSHPAYNPEFMNEQKKG